MVTTERPQVNIRLERDLLDQLDELATAESIDRAELARRLLREGLKRERVHHALRTYREGEVSAARAAEAARISLYEMLDRIHEAGIPYELDASDLQGIDAMLGVRRPRAAAREARARYEAGPRPDAESGIDALREQFRPERVRWLFVGESSPAGGTHFYRANSIFFRATQEAFAAALGSDVPSGPAFLHVLRGRGCWLVDLASEPVNRLPDEARRAAVEAGRDRLAGLISETGPERIVVVKASIAPDVRDAARSAGFKGEVLELPFPVRQWKAEYVRRLTDALRNAASPRSVPSTDSGRTTSRTEPASTSTPTSTRSTATAVSPSSTWSRTPSSSSTAT